MRERPRRGAGARVVIGLRCGVAARGRQPVQPACCSFSIASWRSRSSRPLTISSRIDELDDGALVALDLEVLAILRREIADVADAHAERAARDVTVLQQGRHELLGHVDRDGEADALGLRR